MSVTLLNDFKKDLMKQRGERRKIERTEFWIKVNEFEGEDITKIKLDFSQLIEEEYKEIDKHFKDYIRGKIIDAMLDKK